MERPGQNSTPEAAMLPPLTLLIEWENACDAAAAWVAGAVAALEAELRRCADRFAQPPALLYLYDRHAVAESDIRKILTLHAPDLEGLCRLRFVPTDGLRYYDLKNYGAALVETDITVMLDSDTAAQPGWLAALVEPLWQDPDLMAVGGTTILGYNNLVSRTMALCWNFRLPSEGKAIRASRHVHANNLAVRTAFFRAHPWPSLPTYRKQCTFWIREIDRLGVRWTRSLDAVTIHAPQRDLGFLFWRGWMAGADYDLQLVYQSGRDGRAGRIGRAWGLWAKKAANTVWRVLRHHREVGLPAWQLPAALALGEGYYLAHLAGQLWSAATRHPLALVHGTPPNTRRQGDGPVPSQAR